MQHSFIHTTLHCIYLFFIMHHHICVHKNILVCTYIQLWHVQCKYIVRKVQQLYYLGITSTLFYLTIMQCHRVMKALHHMLLKVCKYSRTFSWWICYDCKKIGDTQKLTYTYTPNMGMCIHLEAVYYPTTGSIGDVFTNNHKVLFFCMLLYSRYQVIITVSWSCMQGGWYDELYRVKSPSSYWN